MPTTTKPLDELFREALDRVDWYRRCLEDVQDGRVVRGLGEAKAGFDSAMVELGAMTDLFKAMREWSSL